MPKPINNNALLGKEIERALDQTLRMASARVLGIENEMIDLKADAERAWLDSHKTPKKKTRRQAVDTLRATMQARRYLGAFLLDATCAGLRVVAAQLEKEFPSPEGKAVAEQVRALESKQWA